MNATDNQWLGIDIGGANLKVSDGLGNAITEIFPLWQRRDSLTEAIKSLVASHRKKFPTSAWAKIALTMTGELADCYQTKSEGVADIIYAAVSALSPLPIRIATVDDRWLSPPEAIAKPQAVAAANWRLTARLVANHCLDGSPNGAIDNEINGPIDGPIDGNALLIDIGSTTADVIPLRHQRVTSIGSTDTERLINHELVYTGVRRTPVSSLLSELPYRGKTCPIATELFATTADVWLLLGKLEADESDTQTADNRPLMIPFAIDRLARCVCADRSQFTRDDAVHAAQEVAKAQTIRIAKAIRQKTIETVNRFYVGGEGEFLARRAIESACPSANVISLSNTIGKVASQCGPAYAAAFLANKECQSLNK